MTTDTLARVEIRWTAVCPYARLEPGRGVAALVGGAQVAIFRTHDGLLYAVGHCDPISGRHVMSRGVVATRGGAPTVTSPILDHVYDLRSGECLDFPGVRVPVYPVRCQAGVVEVGIYAVGAAAASPAASRGQRRSASRPGATAHPGATVQSGATIQSGAAAQSGAAVQPGAAAQSGAASHPGAVGKAG
jgi:nitrite reductase (NADH) small subunit